MDIKLKEIILEVIIGEVTFGDMIAVGDTNGSFWAAKRLNIIPGSYICKAAVRYYETFNAVNTRVEEIEVRHSTYGDGVEVEKEAESTINITDSDYCGIFDYELFMDKDGWLNDINDIGKVCDLPRICHDCRTLICNCGNGSYDCFVGRNKSGDIVVVRVLF